MFDILLNVTGPVLVCFCYFHTDPETVPDPNDIREHDVVTVAVAHHHVPTQYQEQMGEGDSFPDEVQGEDTIKLEGHFLSTSIVGD